MTARAPLNLQRFVDAQEHVYTRVVAELTAGEKRSHWMWFIFPQLQGLGASVTSQLYGIASRSEAIAYLEHPVLGARLRECTQLVVDVTGRRIDRIFSYSDHLKFASCMTLFDAAAANRAIYRAALDKYFDGRRDPLTLDLLSRRA